MDANELLNKPPDVTRSTVQKAVVAIADSPQLFGQLREKLSMVTAAWFARKYRGDSVYTKQKKAHHYSETSPMWIY